MKSLVLTHVPHEGPGTLGAWLQGQGLAVQGVPLFAGDPLPPDPAAFDVIVVMGGPMNVDDEEAHPFLGAEKRFIARAVERGIPLLGICLGAQLIARSAGAPVYRAPVKEIGWGEVTLTPEGVRDDFFRGLPPRLPVLQWHEDTFDLPRGGELLATSEACRHQAFRLGSAVGLQFHVEVDAAMLRSWFEGSEIEGPVLARYGELRAAFDGAARKMYENLLASALSRGTDGPR